MTADTLTAAVLPKPPSMHRLIVAATIGNVFEWFDFVVYGFFAVTLADVFFPTGNPTVSLLVTFGAYGLAYIVRPLGAIVVGGYTDRAGRKAGLLLSMALMMIGTTLMAVTPGYATIGLAAPIIITIARLLQGFSVGGEFGSAVSFLAEHGGGRRGFSASWQFATGGIITALASLFGVTLTTLLTHQELVDWGWRIPYFFGMLIGPAGLYVRSQVVDTPEFIAAEKPATIPISDLLRRHPLPVLLALGISIISNSSFYLMVAWPSLAACVIAVAWLQLVKAGYSGVLPSLLSEQFPVATRAIGVSLGFSTAVTIFGGFAPFVATWLIAQTGNPLSPSYYLIFTALLSLSALIAIQRRSRRRDRTLALAERAELAAP